MPHAYSCQQCHIAYQIQSHKLTAYDRIDVVCIDTTCHPSIYSILLSYNLQFSSCLTAALPAVAFWLIPMRFGATHIKTMAGAWDMPEAACSSLLASAFHDWSSFAEVCALSNIAAEQLSTLAVPPGIAPLHTYCNCTAMKWLPAVGRVQCLLSDQTHCNAGLATGGCCAAEHAPNARLL